MFDISKTYYKVTNEEENYAEFQFKDGLNENPFHRKSELYNNHINGGISCTDISQLWRNLESGFYIREITIPVDAQLCMYRGAILSNKLIFGKRHVINLETFKHFIYKPVRGTTNQIYIKKAMLQWANIHGDILLTHYLNSKFK